MFHDNENTESSEEEDEGMATMMKLHGIQMMMFVMIWMMEREMVVRISMVWMVWLKRMVEMVVLWVKGMHLVETRTLQGSCIM
ncbi:hypothetical protein FRX31_026599 [Thalictrum thalictroides]|uniref:Uncharacterized protein n=1 Tax=Thalictrum thalictroides TaxID=46969 RepID=A0A7J6VFB2_THATH|nr:hypothetical protein FRX31_026599 [Thalictrum thalictroides]